MDGRGWCDLVIPTLSLNMADNPFLKKNAVRVPQEKINRRVKELKEKVKRIAENAEKMKDQRKLTDRQKDAYRLARRKELTLRDFPYACRHFCSRRADGD